MTTETRNLKTELEGRTNENIFYKGLFELIQDEMGWKRACSGVFVNRKHAEKVGEAVIFFHGGCEPIFEFEARGQTFYQVRSLGYNYYTGEF